jgi:hypothetical protein
MVVMEPFFCSHLFDSDCRWYSRVREWHGKELQ